MNKNVKEYFKRGLIFGGFGPIIAAIIIACISITQKVNLAGWQILVAIISTYILAFVQAGSTVFNQIENWPPIKSALLQGGSIYVVYIATYLVNSWIPLKWEVILIFTAIFVFAFALIWLLVYFITKKTTAKLNNALKK
jgi:hypothetical protein